MSHHPLLQLALVAGALSAAAAVQAQSPTEPAPSGMVVVRDPQTGLMRTPTAAELRALQTPPAQSPAQSPSTPQRPTVRPDGTRSYKLSERTMVYSVVTRKGGKLSEHCVEGADAAATLQGEPAPQEQDGGHGHEQK
ncbi:MAG: post-PEP-CTERM-1 domain-containing protein [Gammaproteobacteria bacterium]